MYIYTYIYICIYIHVHDKHHGTYDDIKVQIINYCDANDQEPREDFWVFNLNTWFKQQTCSEELTHNCLTLWRFDQINWLKSCYRVRKYCRSL